MGYSPTTEALLHAIKNDVRARVDEIVVSAERLAMSRKNEAEVDRILQHALLRVEKALAEAAQAMAREIHRERLC
ncbi:MAG: hypothetical protein ACE5JR_01390 [Gemmatimonadota bacterium]